MNRREERTPFIRRKDHGKRKAPRTGSVLDHSSVGMNETRTPPLPSPVKALLETVGNMQPGEVDDWLLAAYLRARNEAVKAAVSVGARAKL